MNLRSIMKIATVNSINSNHTNFKSKLPPKSCKYSRNAVDYWDTFASNCETEGSFKKLKKMLKKLTSLKDDNYLALVKKTYSNGESYSFIGMPKADIIDTNRYDNTISIIQSNNLRNKTRYLEDCKSACDFAQDANEAINLKKNFFVEDSITNVLLKVLEKIVTPKTNCNKRIYNGLNTGSPDLLSRFRAK